MQHEPVDVTTSLAGQGADGRTRAKNVCTFYTLNSTWPRRTKTPTI